MKFISELYCSEPYLDTASEVNLFLSDTYKGKILSAMKFIEEIGADAVTFWCAADWILLDEEGVPIVFRAPNGSARQVGSQHSHAMEHFYAHIPGLKCIAPATPEDAYGMMKTAIRDDNPVLSSRARPSTA